MKRVRVYHYNAFSTERDKGNPAGVVFDGDGLSNQQMIEIAKKVGFNETAFVLKSDVADLRLKYFTPGHEMNLCGHATVASLFGLKSRGIMIQENVTVETNVGILPMQVKTNLDGSLMVTMKQAPPEFVLFEGSIDALASSTGLTRDDIDDNFPVIFGSTGTWTLLVPVKTLEAFPRMTPYNNLFPSVLEQMPRVSIHPFCLETYDPTVTMHARHFSSPFSGTVEDPVTGTASGVMGAYYKKYMQNHHTGQMNLIVEQGHEIGRNGLVFVSVSSDGHDVQISGTGVFVTEFEVEI